MCGTWHSQPYLALGCCGLQQGPSAKPQWQHNPSATQTFPPKYTLFGFFSLISQEAFSKEALHGPHHPGHTRSGQDTRGTTRSTSPVLELKGQLQIFSKCPTPPLALLHLPTQNQSLQAQALFFLALGMLVLLMVPVL